jgi:hypothetical protein
MAHQNQLTYAQGVFVQTKLPELSKFDYVKSFKNKKASIRFFIFFFIFIMLGKL